MGYNIEIAKLAEATKLEKKKKKIDDLVITYHLDPFEKKLLEYFYKNIESIRKIGIRRVAKENYTSTHTVFKLSKKLGYDGYADMAYSLYYEYTKKFSVSLDTQNYFQFFIQDTIEKYEKDLEDILKKYKKKKIIIFGLGYSENVARYLNDRLLLKGYNSFFSTHLQLIFADTAQGKTKPLLIVISESGENSRLVELTEDAKKFNIYTVSFTANGRSTVAENSSLACIINSDPLRKESKYVKTFFAHLIMFFDYILT